MKTIYEFLLGEHLLKSRTATSTQDTDYVDFGLPSGLKWAKCNIGADEPTEYGDYFMWGSTEPNTNTTCNWEHCPFNNGSNICDEDYFESIKNKVCPNGILAPEYDAATVILGNEWRLPTEDDFQELIDNTEHKWGIKNYKGSKVKGMIFTPKNAEIAEANGAELFIPASGLRSKSNFFKQGINGNFWSSSLNTSDIYDAGHLLFNGCACYVYLHSIRFDGFCLRGVTK